MSREEKYKRSWLDWFYTFPQKTKGRKIETFLFSEKLVALETADTFLDKKDVLQDYYEKWMDLSGKEKMKFVRFTVQEIGQPLLGVCPVVREIYCLPQFCDGRIVDEKTELALLNGEPTAPTRMVRAHIDFFSFGKIDSFSSFVRLGKNNNLARVHSINKAPVIFFNTHPIALEKFWGTFGACCHELFHLRAIQLISDPDTPRAIRKKIYKGFARPLEGEAYNDYRGQLIEVHADKAVWAIQGVVLRGLQKRSKATRHSPRFTIRYTR